MEWMECHEFFHGFQLDIAEKILRVFWCEGERTTWLSAPLNHQIKSRKDVSELQFDGDGILYTIEFLPGNEVYGIVPGEYNVLFQEGLCLDFPESLFRKALYFPQEVWKLKMDDFVQEGAGGIPPMSYWPPSEL